MALTNFPMRDLFLTKLKPSVINCTLTECCETVLKQDSNFVCIPLVLLVMYIEHYFRNFTNYASCYNSSISIKYTN